MKLLRAFLCGIAAFALPIHASVVLGLIGTEPGIPSPAGEDVAIYNVTGPIFGCSTAAGTPICTAVTFDNAVLTINGTPLSLGNIGPGYIETDTLPGGVFANGSITSLSFSATLSTTALTDDLGNNYNVSSLFSLTGIPTDGSLPTIAAPLALTSVPEPSSFALLIGLGLAGAGVVSRRSRILS